MVRIAIIFNIIITIFCWCRISNATTVEASGLIHKIAFLKEGEIWTSDIQGEEIKQLTDTDGKIEDFLFSPTLEYVAYSKIIKYVDEPGLWEEGESPQRAVTSIVIEKLKDHSILEEIFPSDWIYISKWISAKKLIYYESSGFDIAGFFEYDIQRGAVEQIDYTKGSMIANADYHKDGSPVAYVDDSGVGDLYTSNLHVMDVKLNSDSIVTSKKSILDPKISHNKEYIAFFEVKHDSGEYFDTVWIYSMKDTSSRKIYSGPSKPKIGGREQLAWSSNDQYLGMFHPSVALILEIQSPENLQTIYGTDFHWIIDNNIIFSQGEDIYIYFLKNKKKELLFESASKPTFLWK